MKPAKESDSPIIAVRSGGLAREISLSGLTPK